MAKINLMSTDDLNQAVLQFLRQDELDYPGGAAKFGEAALPYLQELVDSSDEMMATKAAYLAGYIGGNAGKEVMLSAASNKFSTVRVAAAFSAQSMDTKSATEILSKALDDQDIGVLKLAMKSVSAKNLGSALKSKLQAISKNSPDEVLKASALTMVKKLK